MEVFVCIGSSCHLKGSYDIIKGFKELISENKIDDKVHLNASFCLGECTNGVTIKVEDRLITGLRKDNYEEIFNNHILSEVSK